MGLPTQKPAAHLQEEPCGAGCQGSQDSMRVLRLQPRTRALLRPLVSCVAAGGTQVCSRACPVAPEGLGTGSRGKHFGKARAEGKWVVPADIPCTQGSFIHSVGHVEPGACRKVRLAVCAEHSQECSPTQKHELGIQWDFFFFFVTLL